MDMHNTCIRAEFVSTHKKSSGDLQKYLGGIIKIPVGLEQNVEKESEKQIFSGTYSDSFFFFFFFFFFLKFFFFFGNNV